MAPIRRPFCALPSVGGVLLLRTCAIGSVVACAALGLTACGDPASRQPGASFGSLAAPAVVAGEALGPADESSVAGALDRDDAEAGAGVEGVRVCALLPVAQVRSLTRTRGLRAREQDSLDLASCRYGRGDANVRVMVDGARGATRRFFNMQAEALEFRAQGKGPPVTLVEGVGDDTTYGNSGAYWFPSREALTTFHGRRIIRVIVHLSGRTDAQRLTLAKRITGALIAELPPSEGGGPRAPA